MTLQALCCDACGSRDLVRADDERYRCSHCGASVLVSAVRATANAQQPALPVARGWLFGVAGLLLAAVFAVVLWHASTRPRSLRGDTIDPTSIELSAARPVQTLQGSHARDHLLVTVTNRGTRTLAPPHIVASFFDGATKLDSRTNYAQTSTLRPGESALALIEVPPLGRATRSPRYALALATPLRAMVTTEGPVLKFADARLVERDGHFKLVARVQAPTGRSILPSCRATIVLLDRFDAPVALGDGRCAGRDVAAGETTLIDASFVRFSMLPVARWTYHVDYELAQPAPAPALPVAPDSRQQNIIGTAETLGSNAKWDAAALLRR